MTAVRTVPLATPTRDALLRAQYDKRNLLQKVVDLILSVIREILYGLGVLYHKAFGGGRVEVADRIMSRPNSHALVVMIHGLHGDPEIWRSQIDLFSAQNNVDIYTPRVFNKGICSLEQAASPIRCIMNVYMHQNPGRPVYLLGVSNGSRIATSLETWLREEHPASPVMVSTIAGVHLGSSRMDFLDRLRCLKWFYPEVVREELKYNSDVAQGLLRQVRAPLLQSCPRHYEFFATTEDFQVPDLDSSLPALGKNELYHVVHGYGHNSIVSAVAWQQVESYKQWIHRAQLASIS